MSEIFLKIINMSISASYIVLAVLLLRLLLKKAPKWITVVLWGIVAVRLVCPFSMESVFSLIPSAEVVSPDIMMDKTPTINTGIPIINSTINPVISESFTPNPGDSANPLQIWIPMLTTVWIVGMAALLIYTAISYARVKRRIGTAVLYKDNIYQSENVVSPFVLGIIKPKIYLPFIMNEKDVEHVVAHEMAHIRRKDHLWKHLGFLLLTLHWFNPLMWLGYVLLCRDIELACDEKVIKELDHDARADYSQALLTCSVNRRMIAACPLAFGEVGVKDRVKSVLNYKKPAFWIIIAAVLACVAVAVCFLTNPPKDKAVVPHGSYMLEIYYDLDNELTEPLKQSNEVRVIIDELMDVWIFDGEQLISGGLFKETKLTDKNFDVLFEKSPIEIGVIKDLRKSIRSAWNMTYTSTENGFYPYMVIVDDESQVYLVIADHTDGKPTVISGVFKLHKLIPEKLEPVLFVDFLKNSDGMYSYVDRALSHSDFPDVSFHYTPKEIIAKTGNSETTVLSADKIWNCYFYDITGDGKADLCATVDQNKPFIARRVVVYDYQNNRKYEFADSDVNHYMLSEENGILTINRYENGDAYEEEPSSKGGLIVIENKLSLAFYTQLVGDKQITLDDVLRLSEKGAELTFEDFASYNGKEVGSGLYILSYEIDETFTLRVGGGAPIGKPMYVYLCAKSGDTEEHIDIRDGGVEEFIGQYRSSTLSDTAMLYERPISYYVDLAFGVAQSLADSDGITISKDKYNLRHDYNGSNIWIQFYGLTEEGWDDKFVDVTLVRNENGDYDVYEDNSVIKSNSEQIKATSMVVIGNCFESIEEIIQSNPGLANRESLSEISEYDQMFVYGEELVLEYIFSEFLTGKHDDLHGDVMMWVMLNLLNDNEIIKYDPTNGQDYFDHWLKSARSVGQQHDSAWLEDNVPAIALVLSMLEE